MTAKEIVERSKPAIVRIESVFADGREGVGTGFIVSRDGRIATNLHVIRGAQSVKVTTLGGDEYEIEEVVAVDPERDLAIVEINARGEIASLVLGDSDGVSAGDPVVAIGNPLGVLDYTVSDGLISSVRPISQDLTVLQISAPISHGSSGGPLFNPYGEVIGVATAIFTEGQNLNFGVPSNYLRPLMQIQRGVSLATFLADNDDSEAVSALGGAGPPGDATAPFRRNIPTLELDLVDGCSEEALIETFESIMKAINLGAPLYNDGNHEACFRIYEGAAVLLEKQLECEGLREALGQGLLLVETTESFTEKAWHLRDTFDGILDLIAREAKRRSGRAS